MNKIMKSQKGFTLIELMVVIIIIAILAALAVPLYNNYTNQAKAAEAKNLLGIISKSAKIWATQYSDYTGNGGWAGADCMANVAESKYFPTAVCTTVTTVKYTIELDGNALANPFKSVTLSHTDGVVDTVAVVSVTGNAIPGVGATW